MEECHDVLQAGRARQAKAGKAALFTPVHCSAYQYSALQKILQCSAILCSSLQCIANECPELYAL